MASSDFSVDSLASAFQKTLVSPSGVSFAGKSLKLDTEKDAEPVVEELNKCSDLQFLNLEGNTLGVDASKVIAKALEKHPEFKRALWKDMFTGRMKTEIPKALQFLGEGLVAARAHLAELDLSDNAFGPIGVEGLASLLRSPTCYALEELRLNNNGLGITGGKLLATALIDCYNSSKNEGKPLALKVFIAGRNRLENDGAKALAHVFKTVGTLEEIAMPQNGIYHIGISALSEAFAQNKNLQILNLNDNTVREKGAEAIAKALPNLQNLKEINLGDCLLKTQGAILLADAIKDSHVNLEEVTLGFNEIRKQGGLKIALAMANKSKLKKLMLDGNQFGEDGKEELEKRMKEIGKFHVLGSLMENESEDSDDEVEEEEEEEEEEEGESGNENEVTEINNIVQEVVAVKEFLAVPSADNFVALGGNRAELILKEAKSNGICLEEYAKVVMKVSSLSNNTKTEVADSALKCSEMLYRDLFAWAQQSDNVPLVNNAILIHLGLIKSEDKKFKISWNLDGSFYALKNIVRKNYVPESTKNTLSVFIERDLSSGDHQAVKTEILAFLK